MSARLWRLRNNLSISYHTCHTAFIFSSKIPSRPDDPRKSWELSFPREGKWKHWKSNARWTFVCFSTFCCCFPVESGVRSEGGPAGLMTDHVWIMESPGFCTSMRVFTICYVSAFLWWPTKYSIFQVGGSHSAPQSGRRETRMCYWPKFNPEIGKWERRQLAENSQKDRPDFGPVLEKFRFLCAFFK